jgi:two-component system response regulator
MNEQPILLVEDNPNDIDLTRMAFRKEGVKNELIVAEDGRQALAYLLSDVKQPGVEQNPLPAFVLLDLKLPGMDGFEVLRRIRLESRTRQLPVIILTSSNEDRDLTLAYALGANSYIRKPIDFSVFQNTVKVLTTYWLAINEQPAPL